MEWTRDEFADAVTRHSRRMYRAARSVLDSGADAEDAVSQAILQAWQSLDKLRDREAVGPWLVRIAVNCAYALRRRQGRVVPLDGLAQEPAAPESVRYDGLWEAVSALPPERRAAAFTVRSSPVWSFSGSVPSPLKRLLNPQLRKVRIVAHPLVRQPAPILAAPQF